MLRGKEKVLSSKLWMLTTAGNCRPCVVGWERTTVWGRLGGERWRRGLPGERLLGERSFGWKRSRKEKELEKVGERKAAISARITRRKAKAREAVSKAAVISAASGVIPKVVSATRRSTSTRFGARRVGKGMGWINTVWRHWRLLLCLTACWFHCLLECVRSFV